MTELQFTAEAVEDLEGLDTGALRLVLGKIRILQVNPEAGQPLGSRKTADLTGFRKLVVGDRQYRVVYRVERDGTVCVIWVVAGRVDDQCYDLALERIRRHGSSGPVVKDLTAMIESLKPRARARVEALQADWHRS